MAEVPKSPAPPVAPAAPRRDNLVDGVLAVLIGDAQRQDDAKILGLFEKNRKREEDERGDDTNGLPLSLRLHHAVQLAAAKQRESERERIRATGQTLRSWLESLECCNASALPALESALEDAGVSEVTEVSGLWREGKMDVMAALGCLDPFERARFAMAVQRLNLGSSRAAALVGAVGSK